MSELTDFRVAVLATDGFEETELTEPVKALKEAGAQVTSCRSSQARSKEFVMTSTRPRQSRSIARSRTPARRNLTRFISPAAR